MSKFFHHLVLLRRRFTLLYKIHVLVSHLFNPRILPGLQTTAFLVYYPCPAYFSSHQPSGSLQLFAEYAPFEDSVSTSTHLGSTLCHHHHYYSHGSLHGSKTFPSCEKMHPTSAYLLCIWLRFLEQLDSNPKVILGSIDLKCSFVIPLLGGVSDSADISYCC